MPRYRIYQLTLESEVALPGLPVAPEGSSADAAIRLASLPPLPMAGRTGLSWTASPGEVWLEVDEVASFRIRGAEEILVDPRPAADMEEVALHLRSFALAALLIQKGFVTLYASAVDSPQGALLLLGRPGMGKSTLAAALVQRGYPLLCDEIVAVQCLGGIVWAVPSLPEHRLWADAQQALGLPSGTRLRAGLDKVALPASSWTAEARPVAATFFLTYSNRPAVDVRRADRAEVGSGLTALTYRRRFLEAMGRLPQQLEMATLLTASVPHYQVLRPRDLSRLQELADRVSSSALGGPPGE